MTTQRWSSVRKVGRELEVLNILYIPFPQSHTFLISASNHPHFCGFTQFRAFRTLIREKEMRRKCLQNNLNRASERNAEKLLTIPNRASSLRTSEL